MTNPAYQKHIIEKGHTLAPFLLKASLRPMKDFELVSVTESAQFAAWPERSQETVYAEITDRIQAASLANAGM